MKSKMPKAFARIGDKAILSRAVQSAFFPLRYSPEREMEALRHLKNCTAADGDRRFENWPNTGRVWVSNSEKF